MLYRGWVIYQVDPSTRTDVPDVLSCWDAWPEHNAGKKDGVFTCCLKIRNQLTTVVGLAAIKRVIDRRVL